MQWHGAFSIWMFGKSSMVIMESMLSSSVQAKDPKTDIGERLYGCTTSLDGLASLVTDCGLSHLPIEYR